MRRSPTSGAIPRSGRRSPRRSTAARCRPKGAAAAGRGSASGASPLGGRGTRRRGRVERRAIPDAVVMRRLTNVEYNNTVRDLTAIDLDPAREFPADGAAGEGFTNVSDALVMSPAMLDKYLAAAKGIAAHAVLLPDGIRFSEKTTRPDWTDEILSEIKRVYRRYTEPGREHPGQAPGPRLGLQGGRAHPSGELSCRDDRLPRQRTGKEDPRGLAAENHLSAKYLRTLWQMLDGPRPSPVCSNRVRELWRSARPADVPRTGRRDSPVARCTDEVPERRPLQALARDGEPARGVAGVPDQADTPRRASEESSSAW